MQPYKYHAMQLSIIAQCSYLIISTVSSSIGRLLFSEKVVAQWKKAEEDEFGHDPALLKWARDGGEYPPVL